VILTFFFCEIGAILRKNEEIIHSLCLFYIGKDFVMGGCWGYKELEELEELKGSIGTGGGNPNRVWNPFRVE
jgi:hypothetical protein